MPKPDQPTLRVERSPLSFVQTARACYGPAFGPRNPRAIERARDDWADLADEDRAFALAHLLYLNLMAQAASVRLQAQIRNLLDEIAEGLGVDDEEEPEGLDEEPGFEPAEAPEGLAEVMGGEQGEEVEVTDSEDKDADVADEKPADGEGGEG